MQAQTAEKLAELDVQAEIETPPKFLLPTERLLKDSETEAGLLRLVDEISQHLGKIPLGDAISSDKKQDQSRRTFDACRSLL